VLDAGAPALVSIDLASGERVATLPLSGAPHRLVQTDDGHYIAVLDRGPGEDKGDRGYEAQGRSSATIVEAAGLKAIGRVELGFGLESVLTDPKGRLVTLCPGYDAKDPRKALPRELVVVDIPTARERGRLTVEPGTKLTWLSPDGRTLALLQGLPRSAKYPFPESQITIMDTAELSAIDTLSAGGWDQVMRDDERLYLLVRGKPHKKPEKNVNGWIDVVSFADRRVERVDLGRAPMAGVLRDDGLMAVASAGPEGGTAGELRLLRDGNLAATLPVAARPMHVSELDGSVCVVGARAVSLVDPLSLEVTASIPLEKQGRTIVDDDDRPFEVVATPDGRRALVHYPAQDQVVVLDLEQKRAIGSTKTGRGGKKFLNALMSGLTSGMSERVHFYRPGDPPQTLVRPDGRYAYVLNLDTSDVTIVDTETATVVEKIGAGGHALRFFGDSTLAVVGSELQLIETEHNKKIDQMRLPGLQALASSPGGACTVILLERTVLILDGATAKEHARLSDFIEPSRLVFAPASEEAPHSLIPRRGRSAGVVHPHPRPDPGLKAELVALS